MTINLLIEYKQQPIGFVICFRENLKYESLNYKYFNEVKQKFIYIDRVVIKSDYRRMGLGTRVYKYIDEVAANDLGKRNRRSGRYCRWVSQRQAREVEGKAETRSRKDRGTDHKGTARR